MKKWAQEISEHVHNSKILCYTSISVSYNNELYTVPFSFHSINPWRGVINKRRPFNFITSFSDDFFKLVSVHRLLPSGRWDVMINILFSLHHSVIRYVMSLVSICPYSHRSTDPTDQAKLRKIGFPIQTFSNNWKCYFYIENPICMPWGHVNFSEIGSDCLYCLTIIHYVNSMRLFFLQFVKTNDF